MIGGDHKPTNFPWIRHTESGGDLIATVGGYVQDFEAAATLLIGDAVYVSAYDATTKQPQVNKAAALHALVTVGLVVGGDDMANGSPKGYVIQLDESSGLDTFDSYVGDQAALVGHQVMVCSLGVALATIDVALAAGTALTLSAVTAGQLTNVGAAAGNVVGILLDTTTGANQVARVFVYPR